VPFNPNVNAPPEFWHPPDLLAALTQLACGARTVVEIGSWLGHSAIALAQGASAGGHLAGVRIYCVDHWRGSPQTGCVDDPLELYDRFWQHITEASLTRFVVPIFEHSVPASNLFNQRPIDLLYIDGDHAYAAVQADLRSWVPHVRPGGTICGDDYLEVRPAVTDFFNGWPHVTPINLLVGGRLWWVKVL